MTYLNQALVDERFRSERLEEQVNDLTELHQNEVENLKTAISDMEEKVSLNDPTKNGSFLFRTWFFLGANRMDGLILGRDRKCPVKIIDGILIISQDWTREDRMSPKRNNGNINSFLNRQLIQNTLLTTTR